MNLLPGVASLVVFVFAPLVLMVFVTFWRSSVDGMEPIWNLDNYRKVASDPMFAGLLLKSLRIAVTVTVVILMLAYPLAYIIARKTSRYKHLLLLLVFIPYWISYVIRTYAWYPILGKEGAINYVLGALRISAQPVELFLFNEFSVHVGLVSVFMPFAVVPIYLSLERISPTLLEAAADLGARPARSFLHVVLPLSLPGLLGGALMVFILTVGAYVTPQLLGGPSGIMLGNIIADQFGGTFNWTWGGTLSLMLMMVTLVVIWLVSRRVRVGQVFLGD
ncbi:MAG: ABC transporter permease [Candidatus Rokubacteria bacterium]|nr:ABC transporter permease [Candidatus Rokubacteria bacterium]